MFCLEGKFVYWTPAHWVDHIWNLTCHWFTQHFGIVMVIICWLSSHKASAGLWHFRRIKDCPGHSMGLLLTYFNSQEETKYDCTQCKHMYNNRDVQWWLVQFIKPTRIYQGELSGCTFPTCTSNIVVFCTSMLEIYMQWGPLFLVR